MKYFFILSVIVMFAACSPKIQYVGNRYSPTTNVDIYMNKKDVKKNYTVMGKVNGMDPTNGLNSYEKIQNKIVEKAKAFGADGIIISRIAEFESQPTVVSTTGTTISSNNDSAEKNIKTSTSTSVNNWRELNAVFIKYE